MEYGEVDPGPGLTDHVRCFWWLRSGEGAETGAGAEGVVPDGRPELVLNFAEPFLHHPDGGGGPGVAQPVALLVGQITRPMVLTPVGRVDLVGVRFHASGVHALAGLPMDSLSDGWVDAGDAWSALRGIHGRLAARTSPRERIRELRDVLLRVVDPGPGGSPVAAAEHLIRTSRGRVRVDDVADAVGLGPRQLRRRFHLEAGLGPKTLARIVRFQAFLRLAERTPSAGMTRCALQAGYYDQAHLVRDCRELAGTTPVRFLDGTRPLADHFLEREGGPFPGDRRDRTRP